MKKSRLKLIILEVCFFLLASAYIPFGMFGDAYISKHINIPCDSFGVGIGKPCVYTPLAAWFDYVLHVRSDSAILHALTMGRIQAGQAAYTIAGNGVISSKLTELLIISFWMALLNLAYFGGRRLVRVITPRTAVKSTQSSEDSKE